MEDIPPTLSWQEATIVITAMVLVWSGALVVLVQLIVTWRARIAASREDQYRKLAEDAIQSQREASQLLKQLSTDFHQHAQQSEESRLKK